MVCSVTGLACLATAVVPCVECNFSNVIGLDKLPSMAAGKCAPVTVMDPGPPNPCASLLIINQAWPPVLSRPSPQGPIKVEGTSQCHLILANTIRGTLMLGVSAPLLFTPWLCDKVCCYAHQSYQTS